MVIGLISNTFYTLNFVLNEVESDAVYLQNKTIGKTMCKAHPHTNIALGIRHLLALKLAIWNLLKLTKVILSSNRQVT